MDLWSLSTTRKKRSSTSYFVAMYDKANQKRKVKPFPEELALITDQDRKAFALALEVDHNKKRACFSHEELVAVSVKLTINNVEKVIDLRTMILDHLRQLCKNIGVKNVGSSNKFEIRKSLASYFRYLDALEKQGLAPTSIASQMTSTILRAVNVVFSESFVEDFKKLNDSKSQRDHETTEKHKAFWIRACLAHNSVFESENDFVARPPQQQSKKSIVMETTSEKEEMVNSCGDDTLNGNSHKSLRQARFREQLFANDDHNNSPKEYDEFAKCVFPCGDPYLEPIAHDSSINLRRVTQFETNAFRMKMKMLFKMRQTIKLNISLSGKQSNVAWDFVESALRRNGSSGITKIGLYYFYMRCEMIPDIDSHFQPFMDSSLIGDNTGTLDSPDGSQSVQNDDDDDDTSCVTTSSALSRKRKHCGKHDDVDEILQTLIQNQHAILQHMSDAAADRKVTMAMTAKRLAIQIKKCSFDARLQIAKAIGDTEELKRLLIEAQAIEND